MSQGVTPFEQAVLRVLWALQPGDVITYGEVAEEAGFPGRARAVGHLLAHGPVPGDPAVGDPAFQEPGPQALAPTNEADPTKAGRELPWWRVVAANGRLVPGLEAEQGRRLRVEGVPAGPHRVAGLAAKRRTRHAGWAPGVVAPPPGKG